MMLNPDEERQKTREQKHRQKLVTDQVFSHP